MISCPFCKSTSVIGRNAGRQVGERIGGVMGAILSMPLYLVAQTVITEDESAEDAEAEAELTELEENTSSDEEVKEGEDK